jgi:hypothetical protein
MIRNVKIIINEIPIKKPIRLRIGWQDVISPCVNFPFADS